MAHPPFMHEISPPRKFYLHRQLSIQEFPHEHGV